MAASKGSNESSSGPLFFLLLYRFFLTIVQSLAPYALNAFVLVVAFPVLVNCLSLLVFYFYLSNLLRAASTRLICTPGRRRRCSGESTDDLSQEPLTGSDALWAMSDPPSTIGILMVHGGRPNVDSLRALLDERFLEVRDRRARFVFPRFRQRIVVSFGRYCWVDDGRFDVENHVLAADDEVLIQDEEQLRDYVSRTLSQPLPDDRPPWQVQVFPIGSEVTISAEGIGEARFATLIRVNPALADGLTLLRALVAGLDEDSGIAGQQIPKLARRDTDGGNVFRKLLTLFTCVLEAPLDLLHYLRPTEHHLFLGKSRLTKTKLVSWSPPISLDTTARIASEMGGSPNDVLLSSCLGALQRHLKSSREPIPDVVKARTPLTVHANPDPTDLSVVNEQSHVSYVSVSLPLGLMNPVKRLYTTKAALVKSFTPARVYLNQTVVQLTLNRIPPLLRQTLFGRDPLSLSFSSIPGPTDTVSFCNHDVQDIIYWIPHTGLSGFSVSFMQYNGSIRVGLMADTGIIPDAFDLQIIGKQISEEIDRLARLVLSPPSPTHSALEVKHSSHTARLIQGTDNEKPYSNGAAKTDETSTAER